MTLQQMATVKRWHLTHRHDRWVEYQLWDAVLTCWVLGWFGLPAAVFLAPALGVAVCAALSFAPEAYLQLRRRLHRRGVLRCDWLGCAALPSR